MLLWSLGTMRNKQIVQLYRFGVRQPFSARNPTAGKIKNAVSISYGSPGKVKPNYIIGGKLDFI